MSNAQCEISVVVPIFNEEQVVGELFSRIDKVLKALSSSYEIVFVDDGSKDRSLTQLKELKRTHTCIKLVELARNYGQTAALAAGIDAAHGEVIITMDGDLQHSPEEIPRFLEALKEGYDIVSGWREVRTDNYILRRLPSLCANALARYLTGINMRDFGSTFKAYRGELIRKLDLFGELHRFIPVLADRFGARIKEIPIAVHPRAKGASKYGLSRTLGVFEDIFFLEFYSKYLTKPIRAFGKLFVLFFIPGFVISFLLMFFWAIGTIETVRNHAALLLFSVFLMTVGVQFLVVGILAELLVRIYLNTRNAKIYTVRAVHE